MKINRFHLAFPVNDLNASKEFYTKILSCKIGRESETWVDFDFYGHQIVAHLAPEECKLNMRNYVDGDMVSCRHFGVILLWNDWKSLGEKLKEIQINFVIKPKIRFKNKKGEQGTFFLADPSKNILEFKSFKNKSMIFEK